MRDAIYAVSSFWFTAWVDAGQPDLSELVFKGDLLNGKAATDSLQSAWLKGNIIGRACTN
jgi:hypothetical protein